MPEASGPPEAAPPLPEVELAGDSPNNAIYLALKDDRDAVLTHKVFAKIGDAPPLGIKGHDGLKRSVNERTQKGGSRDAFTHSKCTAAMEDVGTYECSGNIFWLNLMHNNAPSTPLIANSINTIMRTTFASPSPVDDMLDVALDDPTDDASTQKGGLEAVSPEEQIIAFVKSIARDVRLHEEGKLDVEVLKRWKNHVLTAPMRFQVLRRGEDRFARNATLRQKLKGKSRTLVRTTFQLFLDIGAFKHNREADGKTKLTHLATLELWRKKVACFEDGSPDNAFTEGHIDTACTVAEKILKNKELHKALMDADEKWGVGGPLHGWTKYQIIINKCGSNKPDNIAWTIFSILDYCNAQFCKPADISCNALAPSRGGAVGFIRLFLAKKLIKEWMLHWMERTGFPSAVLTYMRDALVSHSNFRQRWMPHNPAERKTLDLSWMGQPSYTRSCADAMQLAEKFIYTSEFDGQIRHATKCNKSIDELMEYSEFKTERSRIEELLNKEYTEILGDNDKSDTAASAGGRKLDSQTTPLKRGATAEDDGSSTTKKANPNPGGNENTEEELDDELRPWHAKVSRMFYAGIHLVAEHSEEGTLSQTQIADQLKATTAARLNGEGQGMVIIYDVKSSGETITAPHRRVPPLREAAFKKVIGAALQCRGASDTIAPIRPGDTILVCDGAKSGNHTSMLNTFKDVNGKKFPVEMWKTCIFYSEESLKHKRDLRNGQIAQIEYVLAFFDKDSGNQVERRRRKFFEGSTTAEVIGPVHAPGWTYEENWINSFANKRLIFGPTRIAVGGQTEKGSENNDDAADPPPESGVSSIPVGGGRHSKRVRGDASMEATFFHQMPVSFWREMIYTHSKPRGTAVISLTPGMGNDALAAFMEGCLYAGVCHTETHKKMLEMHLIEQIKKELANPKSSLYEPAYAEILKARKARKPNVNTPTSSAKKADDNKTKKDKKKKEVESTSPSGS